MSFLTKKSVQRAEKFLRDYDPNLRVISLDTSARTAVDAAKSLNCPEGAIVKSLLFSADDSFILCLVSGDKKASFNKLKKNLIIEKIEMAKAEDVKRVTGYTIGGVSPVGHLKRIDIFIDNNLDRFKELFAAAGHPNCVFKIDFKNLVKITNGSIMSITE